MNSGRPPEADLGEVFFEFINVGGSTRVTAIHGDSGVEVVVIGPVTAHRSDLQRLALNKLRRRLTAP